jgi:hypothetical protein
MGSGVSGRQCMGVGLGIVGVDVSEGVGGVSGWLCVLVNGC